MTAACPVALHPTRRRARRALVLALLVTAAAASAMAGEGEDGHEAASLGTRTWILPTEGGDLSDLRGSIVWIERGDLAAPGAAARVAALTELHARLEPDGLRVVYLAAGSPDEISARARELGVTFPVTVLAESSPPYAPVPGEADIAPRTWLVDANGEGFFAGSPSDAPLGEIRRRLRDTKSFVLGPVVDDAKAAAQLFLRGKLAEAEAVARELLSTAPAATEDLERILGRIADVRSYLQRQAAAARVVGDAVRAKEALGRLVKHFKGTEAGDAAARASDELARDAAAKREISAFSEYERLCTDADRAGDSERRRRDVASKLERFLAKHDGTRSAGYARRLLDSLREDPAVKQIRDFIASQRIDTKSSSWRTSLPKPPQVEFEAGHQYHWDLQTSEGAIRVRLMPDVAPMHVSSTIYLTELGFYDGLAFHRVITGFMAQGGCPLGTGTGGPGYKYAGEFSPSVRHDKPGLLSMANAGPGTDGSQFFLTFKETPWLDGKHTIFGEIVDGMDALGRLEAAGSQSGRPSKPLSIQKATITVE